MESDLDVRSARLLVVDADPAVAREVADRARLVGHTAVVAADARAAMLRLDEYPADAVVCAAGPAADAGLALLRSIRARHRDLPVIFMADAPPTDVVVRATRAGAFDFLSRPADAHALDAVLGRALDGDAHAPAAASATTTPRAAPSFAGIIGRDPAMRRVLETAKTVAGTRATVVITGESGTGKTLVARTIHHHSNRAASPFVEVNCGALAETLLDSELFGHARGAFTGAYHDRVGKFQYADGGTLFLDEIGNATKNLQVKLLRVLQDREFERVGQHETVRVDVRVVLATNVDLAKAVERGDFREDLYYRINVVRIDLPPLRRRPADVAPLAAHFLAAHAREHGKPVTGISEAALRILQDYAWPGNVRELENIIERAVVLSPHGEIRPEDLPPELSDPGSTPDALGPDEILPLKDALARPEKRIIERALRANKWNRQKTAAVLKVNRATLFNKMKKHGLLEE